MSSRRGTENSSRIPARHDRNHLARKSKRRVNKIHDTEDSRIHPQMSPTPPKSDLLTHPNTGAEPIHENRLPNMGNKMRASNKEQIPLKPRDKRKMAQSNKRKTHDRPKHRGLQLSPTLPQHLGCA